MSIKNPTFIKNDICTQKNDFNLIIQFYSRIYSPRYFSMYSLNVSISLILDCNLRMWF
jgi:hypothetical protein